MKNKNLWVSLPMTKQEKIWEWSLVLSACFIDHKVLSTEKGLEIRVRNKDLNNAILEIVKYEQENCFIELKKEDPPVNSNMEPSIWVLFFIFIFYLISSNFQYPFFYLGCADSWAIYKGEWWRLVTALFLHKNIPHVVSNIFWQGIFIYFLLKYIPSSIAWFLILLSGILGNLLNYLYHSLNHISIGFSTCVFGTLGIGIGIRCLSQIRDIGIYIMCGLGLLAMLGMGGAGIDVSSHIFGLITGFFIGIFNKIIVPHKLRDKELFFWLLVFFIISISWALAIIYGQNYIDR